MATAVPPKQIRALYGKDTITVYQAYSAAIALPAVQEQSLSASPLFKSSRVSWIKPSWCWMMYRCGYSYKDNGQEHVLALRLSRQFFQELVSTAILSSDIGIESENHHARVQWDPERGPRLEKLAHRSIQIGIPPSRCDKWVEDGILSIEDVTKVARDLKRALDGNSDLGADELLATGLLPAEKEYPLPANITKQLGIEA